MENHILWSEIGSGFEEPSGTALPRIPRSTTPEPYTKTVFLEVSVVKRFLVKV